MNLGTTAYLLKDSNWVVFEKSQVRNAKDSDFDKVTVFITPEKIAEL